MKIFWTAYVTLSLTAIAWLLLRIAEMSRQLDALTLRKNKLRDDLEIRKTMEVDRMKRQAYRKGLYDGRKTDEIYRSVQKSYLDGKHITVKSGT